MSFTSHRNSNKKYLVDRIYSSHLDLCCQATWDYMSCCLLFLFVLYKIVDNSQWLKTKWILPTMNREIYNVPNYFSGIVCKILLLIVLYKLYIVRFWIYLQIWFYIQFYIDNFSHKLAKAKKIHSFNILPQWTIFKY